MIMHFLDLSFVHSLNVDWGILKPPKIISNQVPILTSTASNDHDAFMIGMFRERSDRLRIAFGAGKTEHIKLACL